MKKLLSVWFLAILGCSCCYGAPMMISRSKSMARTKSLRNNGHLGSAMSLGSGELPLVDEEEDDSAESSWNPMNNLPENLKHSFQVNRQFALELAFRSGDMQSAFAMLHSGMLDPAGNYNFPLRAACAQRQTAMLCYLLHTFPTIDPAAHDNFCIKAAADNADPVAVKALIDTGKVNPAVNDNQPLNDAVMNKDKETIRILLSDERVLAAGIIPYLDRRLTKLMGVEWSILKSSRQLSLRNISSYQPEFQI